MSDEMFFSSDAKSLRRGKRVAKRTETCRPCIVYPKDAPDMRLEGVVMDINPYGMRIRMLEPLPEGSEVSIQLMRDDQFEVPLAPPVTGSIVRAEQESDGLMDHGVKLTQKHIERGEPKPVRIEKRQPRKWPKTRMHTIDVTLANRYRRR